MEKPSKLGPRGARLGLGVGRLVATIGGQLWAPTRIISAWLARCLAAWLTGGSYILSCLADWSFLAS